MLSLHRHNEREQQAAIVQRLSMGERVALVSDAGAPAISDPGGFTVQAVRAAGYEVVALPGASAVTTALMSIGSTTDQHPAFCFLGFLLPKSAARQKQLRAWIGFDGTLVCFEAPHRISAMLKDLLAVFGPRREVSLARELTKRFEQTVTLALDQAVQWIAADRFREQGEYVVLLHPPVGLPEPVDSDVATPAVDAWMDALLAQVSTRDAAKIMAQALGQPKDICYARLLARSGRR
jgi:16S rRNA (cytidine1402-2'-O)-methyltransferase